MLLGTCTIVQLADIHVIAWWQLRAAMAVLKIMNPTKLTTPQWQKMDSERTAHLTEVEGKLKVLPELSWPKWLSCSALSTWRMSVSFSLQSRRRRGTEER